MITGTGLRFSRGDKVILNDIDLSFPTNSTVGILGPNGSGKTTLLRCLFGALPLDAGVVEIDGVPLKKLDKKQRAVKLSVVTQEHESELPMTIAELAMLGRMPYLGLTGRPSAEDEQIVTEALTDVGAIHLATRDFSQLSGGEKQRTLIARALAQRSEHILLDEPTNHLDIQYQHDILYLLSNLSGTTVMVLHDLNLAAQYCDRIMFLKDGMVVADGPTSDVLIPEIVEYVYRLPVRRIPQDDGFSLIFRRATKEFLEELDSRKPISMS